MDAEVITNSPKRYACATCGCEYDDGVSVCTQDGTKLTTISHHLAPGTVLGGRFEIITSVAGGGMGTVYKAKHMLMKRMVAIKTMQPYLVASGASLKRFQQEAQALSSLNHPHILSVYDFFVGDDGLPYLVMDYLEGTNLAEVVAKEGPMEWQRAAKIFSDTCAALGHAHSHGIIHRDVKPANIMLVDFEGMADFVKVIDFGIAKVTAIEGEAIAALTATGDTFGSPQFMSPEQCRAKPLDARSDIYSLGCVLYYCVTGKAPFTGGDSMECMLKHLSDLPGPFDPELRIPAQFEEIVFRCLSKDPDGRWSSMAELRDAFDGQTHPDSSFPRTVSMAPIDRNLLPTNAPKPEPQSSQPFAFTSAPESTKEITTQETTRSAPAKAGTQHLPVLSTMSTDVSPGERRQLKIMIIGSVALLLMVGGGLTFFGLRHREPDNPQQSAATGQSAGPTTTAASTSSSTSTGAANPQASAGTLAGSEPSPPPANVQTPNEQFLELMHEGQKDFKVSDFDNARKNFNAAHNLAWRVGGESDPRYVDSMAWQGRVAYKLGDYQEAYAALKWVVGVRKSRRIGLASLPGDEKLLKQIKAGLRR